MTDKGAMKLALDALDIVKIHYTQNRHINEAITALKKRLAQPEEEPLHPVHIGVDVTREGTAVTAFYRKPDAVMEMFYSQFHPMAQPPQRTEQEPVAWRTYTGRGYYIIDPTFEDAQKNWPDKQHQPLYTSPPQRTWVSLSDEDRNDCLVEADPCECLAEPEAQELMRCVEAKSRSKNQ